MIRITSGSQKNREISTPDINDFRAVQDKTKLAIFSILHNKIKNAKCLDLYAGSGNLGIEALSRGAKRCTFVDKSRIATRTIEENINLTNLQAKSEVINQDAVKYIANTMEKFDIIFADPFYKDVHHRFLFEHMENALNKNGVIVFSHGEDTNIEDALKNTRNLKVYDTKRYGNAYITILSNKIQP